MLPAVGYASSMMSFGQGILQFSKVAKKFIEHLFMAIAGTEWLIDASGCRAEALCDRRLLEGVFERVIAELDLRVVGAPVWHEFPWPGGVTGIALLTESHLTCHTYPEHELLTINLYCCRARCAWAWDERLKEMLGAKNVSVRVVLRGEAATTTPQQTIAMRDDVTSEDMMSDDALALRNAEGGQGV